MTVTEHRIGDVVALQRRRVAVDPNGRYGEIGVRSFGKGIFHKEPVTGAELGAKRVFVVEPGDLVLSNVFAWEGAIAVASESDRGRVGSHRFMSYVPVNGAEVDVHYLRYYFLSEAGLQLIRQASPGSAGRNRTLAIDRFENTIVPLPDLPTQRRVVKRLDQIFAVLRSTTDALAKGSPDMLRRALPPLLASEITRAATGLVTVGDLVEIVSDVVHPGDDPTPANTFVGLQHVECHTGRRLGQDVVGLQTGRKFRFRPGDLLYGYLRPYLNKVWVADRHGLCSVDQYVLRPSTAVPAKLIGHLLRSQTTLDQARRLTHSLQLPRLRSQMLASVQVPDVPADAMPRVVARLDAITARITTAASLRAEQRHTLDALAASTLNHALAHA